VPVKTPLSLWQTSLQSSIIVRDKSVPQRHGSRSVTYKTMNDQRLTPVRASEVLKARLPLNHIWIRLTRVLSQHLLILAEAFSTKHSVARYRELIRFLEHAFSRPLNQLEKKLSQFLTSGDLGYTRAEVQEWVAPRDGAIHGDRQQPEDLVMERDVRRFLPRMEQAAYDVLFNKAVWHDASQKRRQALRHHAATTSATDIRITQGHDCAIHSQILDPFDAYPLNLDGNPESTAAWLVVSTSK